MKTKRIWEIDALRGVAIVMMIAYHTLWGLNLSGLISYTQINTGFWRAFAYTTATIFIFLVGVSLTLSFSRVNKKNHDYVFKYIQRGLAVFGCGAIITALTYLLYPDAFVYFGILHFIGVGIILAIPFLPYKKLNLVLGAVLLALGTAFYNITLNVPWFMLLGFRFWGMSTLDFFPILPWFGVILLGIFVGNAFIPNGRLKLKVPEIPLRNALAFLGRYSLIIYFLHIILIFGAIFIIKQFWL
ncbi:MAG: heparan-alpha-glucosaminide N-acetyltransferase [Candidatus Nanoarchaeia archaeon]|nr:heparan-alpha-glucosaminide N-acetyltransferase [Candidatus Nanoarchaeia archaeon]MDD5239462.1 heparan-alpha-glucosaminide N-acetyltransferase [Candidatus Nanoarchaeia archaeon]